MSDDQPDEPDAGAITKHLRRVLGSGAEEDSTAIPEAAEAAFEAGSLAASPAASGGAAPPPRPVPASGAAAPPPHPVPVAEPAATTAEPAAANAGTKPIALGELAASLEGAAAAAAAAPPAQHAPLRHHNSLGLSWVGGGADLWIERYDGAWLAMGWCAVLGVMAVVPFALVFGVASVLWLWWVIALVICLCVWAMHESNSVGISPHNHMALLMVVVLALRTAILGTSVVEPVLPAVLSLLQLVALLFIMAVRAHPFPVAAAVFVLIQLCRDMLVIVARDHSSVAHAQVALAMSLGCLGLTYALHWDAMHRWLKARFHIDGDRHLCGAVHHRMALLLRKEATPASVDSFRWGLAWVRRILVLLVYWSYAVLNADLTNHRCSAAGWGAQWGGWMAITLFLVLMSTKISPLVTLDIGTSATRY